MLIIIILLIDCWSCSGGNKNTWKCSLDILCRLQLLNKTDCTGLTFFIGWNVTWMSRKSILVSTHHLGVCALREYFIRRHPHPECRAQQDTHWPLWFSAALTSVILSRTDLWDSQPSEPRGVLEGNVLFNDALNTFYLQLYGVTHIVTETRCRHIGYSFWLAARVLLICIIPQTG